MNRININGSKGSVSIDLTVLPDNLAEVIVLANKMISGVDAEGELTELDRRLLGLIRAGTLLQAVKLKKEESGMGLKESKDYCDALKAKFVIG